MKTETRTERYTALEMNEEERNWLWAELKANHQREPQPSQKMRRKFIDALERTPEHAP